MEAGELLLIVSADVVGGIQRGGFSQEALLKIVREMHDESIETIVDHLARLLPLLDGKSNLDADRSLLLVRRRF